MSNITLKRPKNNETEEDLLQFQEEFLKSGSCSSAVLVDERLGTNSASVCDKTLNTKINQPRETKKVKFDNDSILKDDVIIGNSFTVTEKETSSVKVSFPVANASSFPKVIRIDQQTKSTGNTRKSLFAQQMQSLKEKSMKEQNTTLPTDQHRYLYVAERSNIIDGSGLASKKDKETLAKEIHEENLKKLKEMPVDEILNTQKNLLQTLDPNVVAFLKSRRKVRQELNSLEADKVASKIDESPMEIDSNTLNKLDLESASMVQINEEELPINPSHAKQWLNMDKVEIEKLEWMTNLPVSVDQNQDSVARFDFEGNIIIDGVDIPVHEGLHHHGDQPEYPGYTLEELFRLSQSSLLSQKTLGLATLGKIILKCHEGCYDKLLSRPLLPDFVAGYVIPMLRVALDDNTPQCIIVSVAAIYALIVSSPDELSLSETFLWYRGEELPFSEVEIKLERNLESGQIQQDSELSDIQVVELDIIKGFLRMDLLPRLRYILEVLQPPAQVVINILDILAKVARHSVKSANLVLNTPRLLSIIFKQFCPTTWINTVENRTFNGKLTSLYGIPTYQAVKLLRILSSAGRDIAANLLSQYNVMDFLLCYLSRNYQDHKLPAKEAMMLCLECLHSWQVFLHYGLTLQSYRDFYSLMMKQLTCFQNICLNVDGENHSYDCDYAASWIKLLSAILRQIIHINDKEFSRNIHLVDWDSVAGLIDIIEFCLIKWMWEIRTSVITRAISRLIATGLNFVSNYYRAWSKQPNFNASACFERLEKFVNKGILQFISTSVFEAMINGLRINSILMDTALLEEDRYPSSLPSLNSVLWGGLIVPILQSQSSFSILTDLIRCINIFHHLRNSLFGEIKVLLLENSAVLAYLNGIILSDNANATKCWFARFEIYFLYNLIKLCASKKCNYMSLYHNVSLKLLHLLQKGDEVLLERLISLSIFNVEFIRELKDATIILDNLKLEDTNSSTDILLIKEVSHSELIGITSQNMPNIQRTYQSLLSEIINSDQPSFGSLSKYFYWKPLLTEDFIYYPIISKYRQQLKHNSSDVEKDSWLNSEVILHCLQLCHLYECLTKRTRTSPNLKYCYLSMAFMISSDIFLHPESRHFLEGCIQKMSSKKHLLNLNLELSLEGGSFNDFFTELLNQFEGTSYGDHLFGMMILIAMQRSHSIKLRGAVWLENTVALSLIRVTIKELLVPLRYYLDPVEDDENLLASYFKALLNGNISLIRNPVLYLIAIHHLHNFLFDDSSVHELLKENIAKILLDLKYKVLAHHILCYIEPEANCDLGFVCSENVSASMSNKINKLTSKTRSVLNK